MRIASWTWGGRDHVGTLSAAAAKSRRWPWPMPSRGALGADPGAGTRRAAAAGQRHAPAGRGGHAARAAAAAAAQPVLRRPQLPRACGRAGRHGLPRQPAEGRRLADRLRQAARMRDRPLRRGAPAGRGGVDARSTTNPSWPWSSAAAGATSPRSRAMDHVFGYTIVNDVTARDVQVRHQQWDLGKSFDTFCPMGPCIVTRRRARRPRHARARLGQRRAAPGRATHAT